VCSVKDLLNESISYKTPTILLDNIMTAIISRKLSIYFVRTVGKRLYLLQYK